MTTGLLALAAITVGLLVLGGWIGRVIDANRRAALRDERALRLSQEFVNELNLFGGIR